MAREGKPSPVKVTKYLKGIDFPANKDDLIDWAEDNEAPEDVIDMLEQLPDEEYESVSDVTRALSDVDEEAA